MSYFPSSSLGGSNFLPGISSLPDGRRTNQERMTPDSVNVFSETFNLTGRQDFANTWSIVTPIGQSPAPCSGQTIIYWPNGHSIISAYGRGPDGSFISDFWKFSLDDQHWTKLNISNVSPRAACGSAIVDNTLWFFGGITSTSFTRDLHYVDLITGEVFRPATTGEPPPECALPLVAYHNHHLIVWAGTNGSNLSSLHVL